MRSLGLGIVLAAAFVAGGVASASEPHLSLEGVWTSRDRQLSGAWVADVTVAGQDVSGYLTLTGIPGLASGRIAGSWDRRGVGVAVLFGDREFAVFRGRYRTGLFAGVFSTGGIGGTWRGHLREISPTSRLSRRALAAEDPTAPTITVAGTSGRPGQTAALTAMLRTADAEIAGLQVDVSFDAENTPIARTRRGTPDCAVDPTIGKQSTVFGFIPPGCDGQWCTSVRAIILSLDNFDPIADGSTLFRCTVGIPGNARPGIYPLVTTLAIASDANATAVTLSASNGEVTVTQPPGCGISYALGSADEWELCALILPLLLIVAAPRLVILKRVSRAACLALLSLLLSSAMFAAELAHPSGGYLLSGPETWYADTSPTRDTTVLRSAPVDTYAPGGLLPAGAAEIIVQVLPSTIDPSGEIDRLARDTTGVDRSFDKGQYRASYAYEVGPGTKYREVNLLFPFAGRWMAVALRHYDGDPKASEYLTVFDAVRTSIVERSPTH